ncbi:MAG: DUF72 domain-containing protein [Blastocatellia bacterium]|nr:MAG: DUF72 domain-containing protein [Blastocatellia bacterium]
MKAHQQVTGSTILIGCSGWQYRHWRGDFYPQKLPLDRWLEYYASRFDTVEINNTFYRLPEGVTFGQWRRRVPRGFVFAVKASRFLTHMKKLKDPEDALALFFCRARALGPSMGPVLYQLPPRWPVNIERLRVFLRKLPKNRLHALEFRDVSWYGDTVIDLMKRYKIALCLHDMQGSASHRLTTAPFVYLRFHGTAKYAGSYDDETLEGWADWLSDQARAGLCVYVYFNNDVGGHAPRDAARLQAMINKRMGAAVVRPDTSH